MNTTTSHDHTQARETALKILYQIDLRRISESSEIQQLIEEALSEMKLEAGRSRRIVERYTRTLVHGVLSHTESFDGIINQVAVNWDLERMAIIDRNVIRMGAFEILKNPEIPRAVAINEAIELARKFSTEESGTFVNGILDQIKESPIRENEQGA